MGTNWAQVSFISSYDHLIPVARDGNSYPENHSRNFYIFVDGEVDSSPTGTGVSARAAIHYSENELSPGRPVKIGSIVGTYTTMDNIETPDFNDKDTVIPGILRSASKAWRNRYLFDLLVHLLETVDQRSAAVSP